MYYLVLMFIGPIVRKEANIRMKVEAEIPYLSLNFVHCSCLRDIGHALLINVLNPCWINSGFNSYFITLFPNWQIFLYGKSTWELSSSLIKMLKLARKCRTTLEPCSLPHFYINVSGKLDMKPNMFTILNFLCMFCNITQFGSQFPPLVRDL